MNLTFIQINSLDTVAVAIVDLPAGKCLSMAGRELVLLQDIPAGHKFALKFIAKDEEIIKYGYPIGHSNCDIEAGCWVHEHNLTSNLSGVQEYDYKPVWVYPTGEKKDLFFHGYKRANGKTGIRNEIWIVPTVGCVNGVADELVRSFLQKHPDLNGIDAVVAMKHPHGCSQLGDDLQHTKQILKDIVLHPNAGGVLVLGLGCEFIVPEDFKDFLGDYDKERIRFLVTQDVSDELTEGLQILDEMYSVAKEDKRTPTPLYELKVGLKCGGSDGFSGITANPLLGLFSDFLTAQGGTTVLTEVPEMYGAETILMNRCLNQAVFEKTVHLINDFKNFFIQHNEAVSENPSPGNKTGGITTLEEKSLGCTQKSGQAVITDVLAYGERLHVNGLNLLSAPGNDLVATTALGAAGCQLVLFTTGRGTPFGSFIPTLKISTNTHLAQHKPAWIDFDAGTLLEGKSFEQVCNELINFVIETANGKPVCHEKINSREITIFKTGVTT